MSLPVAVQVYSVRGDASEDLKGTLKKIKDMGYDGVEFAGLYGHTGAEVKEMCEELGLVPISAHVPYLDMIKDPHGVLSTYAEIGCKYVAVPHLTPELRPGTENFPFVVKTIGNLGEVAKELGIQLLYHNHTFEFITLNGKYGLDILYETVPEELLKTEIDVCWVKVAEVDPAGYIEKYSGRAPIVHLKDYVGEKSENMFELIGVENKPAPKRPSNFEFRSLGEGRQSFPEILKASEAAGAEWVVVEQDKPTPGLTPMECIKLSRDYLKSLGW